MFEIKQKRKYIHYLGLFVLHVLAKSYNKNKNTVVHITIILQAIFAQIIHLTYLNKPRVPDLLWLKQKQF